MMEMRNKGFRRLRVLIVTLSPVCACRDNVL